MIMELIKVGANGQLEIDFDSLEAITSKELVDNLKLYLSSSDGDTFLVKKFRITRDSIHRLSFEFIISNSKYRMYLGYQFFKYNLKFESEYNALNIFQDRLDWANLT